MIYSNKIKILLIDDEEEFCVVLQEYLEGEGYEVSCAGDGQQGIEKFRTFKPDIVFLDIRMPNSDGLRTLKAIREERDVPVMMMTAVGGLDVAQKCLEMGAESYMIKPIKLDDVKANISHILHTVSPKK